MATGRTYGNWECCCCITMYTSDDFNFCTKRHILCTPCFKTHYVADGCTECRRTLLTELLDGPRNECIFKEKGCLYAPTYPSQTEKHIKECKYRSHSCEGSVFGAWKCGWTGEYHQLEEHYRQEHKEFVDTIIGKKEMEVTIDLDGDLRELYLLNHQDELFYLKHQVDQNTKTFYLMLQMIGPEDEAMKFRYRYNMKINTCEARLGVEKTCVSDADEILYVRKLQLCVTIPLDELKNYLHKNVLKYDIAIFHETVKACRCCLRVSP